MQEKESIIKKIDSSVSDYIYNIDLSYDRVKLFEEIKDTSVAPFTSTNQPQVDWWFVGRIENIGPEVKNIIDQIAELTESKNIIPKLIIQEKDSTLPLHTDVKKDHHRYNLCAVNIQLTTEVAPVEFEKIGILEPYHCALLNNLKEHGVPMISERRIFMKNSIYDIPYDVALSNYLKNK
tara:strand:- start:546 stop:1082 length:537 start_codon:yes stop_codon:yes gene_type:complete